MTNSQIDPFDAFLDAAARVAPTGLQKFRHGSFIAGMHLPYRGPDGKPVANIMRRAKPDPDTWEATAAAWEPPGSTESVRDDIHHGHEMSSTQPHPERPKARVKPTTYEDPKHPGIFVGQMTLNPNVR